MLKKTISRLFPIKFNNDFILKPSYIVAEPRIWKIGILYSTINYPCLVVDHTTEQ